MKIAADRDPKSPPKGRLPDPVDHEVRPTSKRPMPAAEREIRDECRLLGEIQWDKVADRLIAMYRHDRAGSTVPDGRPTQTMSTDIPAADPEALTPTERAVNAVVFAGTGSKETRDKTGKIERDPYREAYVRARAALGQAALAAPTIIDNVRAGSQVQTWERPAGQTAPECKTTDCNGVSVARGLCNACRMYVDRLKEKRETDGLPPFDVDPIVPATVIASRGKRKGQAA